MGELDDVARVLAEKLLAFEPEAAEARSHMATLLDELADLQQQLEDDWTDFVQRASVFERTAVECHDALIPRTANAIDAISALAGRIEQATPVLREALRQAREAIHELDDNVDMVAADVATAGEALAAAMRDGLPAAASAVQDAFEPVRDQAVDRIEQGALAEIQRLDAYARLWAKAAVNRTGQAEDRLSHTHVAFASRIGEARDLVAGQFVRPASAAEGALVASLRAMAAYAVDEVRREHQIHTEMLGQLTAVSSTQLGELATTLDQAGRTVDGAAAAFEAAGRQLAGAYDEAEQDLDAFSALLAEYSFNS